MLRLLRQGTATHGTLSEFKWAEENRTETVGTLNANYVAASGTITLVSTTAFKVGDFVTIQGHFDASFIKQVFKVTAIGATTLTVTVVAGTDASFTNPSPAAAVRIIRSDLDNETNATGKVAEPVIRSSFLQLIRVFMNLGRKAIREAAGGAYQGLPDLMARGGSQKMDELTWYLWRACLDSIGQQEVSPNPAKTKGLSQFINTASSQNRINAAATKLKGTQIENLLAKLIQVGLDYNETKILLCHPDAGKNLASELNAKVTLAQYQPTLGTEILAYHAGIPGLGLTDIVVDANMERSMALLLSTNWIELVPAEGRAFSEAKETTVPQQYGYTWEFNCEFGLKVMYALEKHGVIYNIDPDAIS
jgi:hypothetical protein